MTVGTVTNDSKFYKVNIYLIIFFKKSKNFNKKNN